MSTARAEIRIAGINIPANKHIWCALTSIYGIGKPTALKVCVDCGIESSKVAKNLTQEEEDAIRDAIKQYIVEGDLRRQVAAHIERLKRLKCYRGYRHFSGLPTRGQRTKTNARTRKNRKGKKLPKEVKG